MYTSQDRVSLVVPLTPPSVNHYKEPALRKNRFGIHKTFVLTTEAKAFLEAVAIFARGETLVPEDLSQRKMVRYGLFVTVYQGLLPLRRGELKQRNETGDGDNYWKCIADGLGPKYAGVIHDDRCVRTWCLEVDSSDRENPRTEIVAVRCNTHEYWKAITEFSWKQPERSFGWVETSLNFIERIQK